MRSGYWAVFDTKGDEKFKPLCGMKTRYADVKASIMIKYILGSTNLTVHIFKEGWRFPADKPVQFPITLGFDKETFGQTTAMGMYNPETDMAEAFKARQEKRPGNFADLRPMRHVRES